MNRSTTSTSQTKVYLGCRDLFLNTPTNKAQTFEYFPTGILLKYAHDRQILQIYINLLFYVVGFFQKV